jgi:hypothetical protein
MNDLYIYIIMQDKKNMILADLQSELSESKDRCGQCTKLVVQHFRASQLQKTEVSHCSPRDHNLDI